MGVCCRENFVDTVQLNTYVHIYAATCIFIQLIQVYNNGLILSSVYSKVPIFVGNLQLEGKIFV